MCAFWADLWRRKWFRWTFTPLAAITLSWCCICLILNHVGGTRWQQVKARLEAEGETFDYFALLPPPIPDDQNFGAIEALSGIRASDGTSEVALAGKSKRDVIAAQCAFLTYEMRTAFTCDPSRDATPPETEEILKVFSERPLRVVRLPPLKDKSVPALSWPEVRIEMEQHAPLLVELSQGATRRFRAESLPRLSRHDLPEVLYSMRLKEASVCQDLANLCRAYSVVCMHCGDQEASLGAARVLLRLADASQSHTTLLGSLIAINQQAQFISLAWLHLQGRHLGDPGLQVVQDELQRLDFAGQCLAGFRSEVAMTANYADYLQVHPMKRWTTETERSGLASSSSSGKSMQWLCALMPSGFFSLSKASTVDLYFDHIILPLRNSGLRNLEARITSLETSVSASSEWKRPDLWMPRLCVGTFAIIQDDAILYENERIQAILACCLERHYFRHLAYPETLDELDPDLKKGLSLLDVNGEKMRYKITPDSRYRLWSPGPNGVDDGGKFGEEVAPGSTKSITSKRYKGDWVWRYEPPAKTP